MIEAKGIAFALLACLLVFGQACNAFDRDKLYRYDFEGTVTTRVADDEKPQYSGLAISSAVLVKRSGSNELTVKLDGPKLATFNELIGDLSGHKFDYKPFEQQSTLDKAFKIYLEGESVKSFDTYKDEAKWVTNFKRGLLSFFQLKLQRPEEAGGENKQAAAASADQSQGQYYTATEKSVFGECETDYLIMNVGSNALNVTKTRNMAKCKTRFVNRFMAVDSNECFENERELQQYSHSNSIFNFVLEKTHDDNHYSIKQALLDEVTSYSPFGPKAHSHLIQTKFALNLNRMDDQAGPSVEEGSTRLENLSYDPPEMLHFYVAVNLEEEHHLSNIYQLSATVDQAMALFDQLVQEHRAYNGAFDASQSAANGGNGGEPAPANLQETSRLAELFLKLARQVGTMNLQKIETLYGRVDERGETHKKIFWDLMSVVGTNPSFVFMKKLITEGDAPSVKIKDFLTRLSYHIKSPSKSLFDEYVNLCKSDKIQSNQQYKRICSLPLASLIHQHCAKPHAKYLRMQQEGANAATAYKKAQNTCQIATAEEYFSRLVSPNAGASSSSSSASGSSSGSGAGDELSIGDKMFNIKMAGELGVKPSIDFLMETVRNKEEHPSLRAAAMWNLIKAARIYPAQVKRLVVPYYYDSNELLELRLAAFHNWFISGMSLHEMETMAKQLNEEPSRQLVVYVHSLIKSLSELAPSPCSFHSAERHARSVLPTIKMALKKHSHSTMFDSRASISSTWLQDYGYAKTTMNSVIFSNESMAPSNVFFATTEIMGGLQLSPMMVSIQAHGLDKLIKRVVGINGLLADKESFMDVFSLKRRAKRQVSADLIKQEAAEIDKELKLSTREFSDVYLSVTVYAYGRPVTFFDKDSRELKKMLSEDGTIKIPQIKKLLHSFNNHTTQQMMINFEKLEVFNNELGLPLYRSLNDFDYRSFKLNNVKFDVEPGFFKDERQGKPPTRISASLDARMGRHNEFFITSGALLLSEKKQVGVGFHKRKVLNIPLKMSVEANLQENKITIKRQPIHENLLYIKQCLGTFVRSYDPNEDAQVRAPSADNKASWLPLYNRNNKNQMKSFKFDYMTPLAVGLKVEAKHRVGQDWSPASWRRYLNSVGFEAAKFNYFYSPTGAPMELRVSTVTTEENPTKDLISVFSWKHHHHEHAGASDAADHDHDDDDDLSPVDKELEQFTSGKGSVKLEQAGRPSTVNYKLALIGGSKKERKVSVDINYSRSFDCLLHKWRVFYQRTPLDQAAPSSEVTNLCWNGQMQFPRYNIERMLKFDLLDMDHSANMSSELTFGDECSEGKLETAPSKVSMRVNFDWSEEQRNMIEAALGRTSSESNELSNGEEAAKNPFLQMYKRCLKVREQGGAKLDSSCVQLLYKMSELTHISSVIDYKDVPERWTKMVGRLGSLYTYARAGYIEEMDDKPHGRAYKSSDGKQDRAHLSANMTSNAHDRKLSYEFDTPNYHVMYRNLPISVPPLSTFPLFGDSYYQMARRSGLSKTCTVSGQQVQTFDNYTYTMPSMADGCFKLITKDCSPEANFIVLGAKVGSGKVVKVYIAQKFKVEFVPDKDGKRISDIKVNGETVNIEPDKAPLRRETKLGATKTVEAFTIENNGAFYRLSSKLYKFSVSTDGTWIFVQQGEYYAGKSCGICGDANGDHLLELKSPSSAKKICKNTNDFVWSYVLPSTCASRPTTIECA